MKTITSSVGFQDEVGNILANGSLIFTLPQGVYVVISGGGQVVGQSGIINLDGAAKVPGSTTIWASDELSPSTPYSVTLCAQANGLQPVATATWFIGGTSPIDLSQMVQTSNGISYSGAVLLNPTAQQNINGQTLNMEGASVGFSATGSTVPDSFFSRLAAGVVGVGTVIGNALGTLRTAILQIGGSDTGLSRDSAGVIDVGNGTQGDISGTVKAANVTATTALTTKGTVALQKSDGTLPATISNDSAGGLIASNNAGKQVRLIDATGAFYVGQGTGAGILQFGSTSGNVTLVTPAVAGTPTLTWPTTSGNIVSDSATQALTNKNLTSTNSGNSITLLNSQDTLTAVTGNGADQTIYTYTIPANTIQAGKGIRVTATVVNNNAVAPGYKLKLGATTVFSFSGTAVSGDFQRSVFEIFNNAGVQNAQTTCGLAINGPTYTLNNSATSAENTANALAVVFTASEANPNTVTPKKFLVEQIQ